MKYKVRDATTGEFTREIHSKGVAEKGMYFDGKEIVEVHQDRAIGEGVIYVRKVRKSSEP